jgi:hypothetical protein
MPKKNAKKKILWGLLIVLVIIQFIRPEKNKAATISANDLSKQYDIPANVQGILKKSCYDCHSNNTKYPWYSEIQPVGWWLQYHVNEGKAAMNLSEYLAYEPKDQHHIMEELMEEVKENHMPLNSYLWIHKGAKLTKEEKETMLIWAGIVADLMAAKHNLE